MIHVKKTDSIILIDDLTCFYREKINVSHFIDKIDGELLPIGTIQKVTDKQGNTTNGEITNEVGAGIIVFKVSGWGDASGHVTLWNGNDCGDSCYFIHSTPNVRTTDILFWNLR